MKIGIELAPGGDPGELFADARAFEAAGADSLWVRGSAGLDPWTILGGLAAVTWRVRLVGFALQERDEARETVESLSRHRLALAIVGNDALVIPGRDGAEERWALVDFPQDRKAWKDLCAAHESQGTAGLVLRNDPRLLDLIRNPDVEEDRQDQKLAFG